MSKDNSGALILGAGLAGLGAAEALPGARVFEAQDQPGGHARADLFAGVSFDQGAHICHTENKELLARLVQAAGDVNHLESSRVGNYWREQWLTYPVQNHLHELPLEQRVQALSDLVVAHANRTIEVADYEQWCRAQYGDFLTDHFYSIFTRKYWRVPMKELATDWLAGRLLPAMLPRIVHGAFEHVPERQTHFARFHYPRQGGFFRLFEGLYQGLDVTYSAPAVSVDSERRVVEFANGRRESYDWLLSSIPLPELVKMTVDAPASVREAAARLRNTKLICVDVVVQAPPPELHWMYVYDSDVPPSRVSFPTNLSGSASRDSFALQAEIFRGMDEPFEVDALVEDTVKAFRRMKGFPPLDACQARGRVIERAYVVSDAARASAVEHIETWLSSRRIATMGLFGRWKYAWSDQAYQSGWDTARRVEALL